MYNFIGKLPLAGATLVFLHCLVFLTESRLPFKQVDTCLWVQPGKFAKIRDDAASGLVLTAIIRKHDADKPAFPLGAVL